MENKIIYALAAYFDLKQLEAAWLHDFKGTFEIAGEERTFSTKKR